MSSDIQTRTPTEAPEDTWSATLIDEFDACVFVVNQQIGKTSLTDPNLQKLKDQRQQYSEAIWAIQGEVFGELLMGVSDATTQLQNAADAAKAAVVEIRTIANAVGLAAALLGLAAAIAGAAATGNPGGIVPAAKGVITAANNIIPAGSG